MTGEPRLQPMRVPLHCTLLLLGSVGGCKPDIPDPIWKGEHLHYSTTTSEAVCRGSFFRQEQHVVELAALLGIELREVIHYTRVSPGEIADHCEGLELEGCAYVDSPFTFSIKSFLFHELSHAVAHLGGINGAQPFAEGFAEVFSDGGKPDIDRAPIDGVLRNFASETSDYFTAGLFSRFLIERHGVETFVDFLRATDLHASFDQFAPVFKDVFGEPIETAMVDFEGYPSCFAMSNRIALVDCNLPLEPWQGQTVTLTANVACDQDDVLGPASDDVMFTTRGFQIDQAGSYAFFASAPEGWSGIRVVKCGSCSDVVDFLVEPGTMGVHDLTPGRYYAILGRKVDEPAELGLAIGAL